MEQQDLKAGETAFYEEDEIRFTVEVVENRCDANREAYRLKILKIAAPDLSRQAKEGDEFNCDQTREEGRDHLKWRLIKTQ